MPQISRSPWALVAGAAALFVAGLLVWIGSRDPSDPAPGPGPLQLAPSAGESHPGWLHGRVTTVDGETYVGRLRWGGREEALWGHYFNGRKKGNPWIDHLPREKLTEERPLEIFGLEIARRERKVDFGRPFMARFGDIARIDAKGRDLRVTLKSGTVLELDRYAADDFADGLRIHDIERGIVDLDERRMRTVELLAGDGRGPAAVPLHGTVRTRQGAFTGLIQWNREACSSRDELAGFTDAGRTSFRFETIRSIARDSADGSRVTSLDGGEVLLSGTPEVGRGNRGIYVDDRRYGRVLVSWEAFERVDFDRGGDLPAYVDFPPGEPLGGRVTTRGGDRLAGRLIFDLDESETTETLDAPFDGVHYTIPFGLIASIQTRDRERPDAEGAWLTLRNGEEVWLERAGDLGTGNAGLLVFSGGDEGPDYVPWSDVDRIELDPPGAMYPALDPTRDGDGP